MMLKVLGVMLLVGLAWSQEEEEEGYTQSLRLNVASLDADTLNDLNDIQDNFNSTLAAASRRNNFFCLERTTTYMDSEYVRISYDNYYEQDPDYVWSIFVQFPVLAYLDTSRKRALIDVIVQVLNSDGTPPGNGPTSTSEVCLGPYDVYEITTFQESVMIHIYGNDDTQIMASDVSDHFESRVNALVGNSDYVVRYPGQDDIIAFNLASSVYYNATKLHPGGRSSDGADPTILAVFLASYGSNVTIDGDTSVSRNLDGSEIRGLNFATNPNPVNYGLEPGDIVFAVFGSLLLVVVCGVTVFGYFIHPFFFA